MAFFDEALVDAEAKALGADVAELWEAIKAVACEPAELMVKCGWLADLSRR